MRITKLTLAGAVALMLGLAGCSDKDTPNVAGTRSLRPYATDPLEVPMPGNSIYLFQDRDFRGNVTRVENVTAQPALTPHRLEYGSDKISGLRWRLPPGVVAVLYEDAEGRGDQVVVWGDGQMPSLAPWKFNDKVSRWSWAYIGDRSASSSFERAFSERPLDAHPTGDVPIGVIEAYKDRDLKGTMTTIGPVRDQEMGVRHPMGWAARDKASSLRWNLPPGVLVILYEDAGGYGRQLALWGKGQYESVSEWDFNDKASRWAWYDISGERVASRDHAWTR